MINEITDRVPEILAPAGGPESLEAAVRSGADAVYLGGKRLNARQGAVNFDGDSLAQAVSYAHICGVAVYQTVNTLVFEDELADLATTLEEACAAGVDAIIVQDLAVASMAKKYCPSLPLHASTQMAIHNLDGAKMLEQLGFERVVLARELSLEEIRRIASSSRLELEVFVHGALCMCVSGQCTLSAMIGGRSGNRGLCAQPCRLPFRSSESEYALSLKDLSAVGRVPALAAAGVKALKIEGRLKRPEYVAAAVRACRQAIAGETPDMEELRAVFSRSGFTCGYLDNKLGDAMFGVRQKEDVAAAAPVLKGLARLYGHERQSVALEMELTVAAGVPVTLRAADEDGNIVTTAGQPPAQAQTKPITEERAWALLKKTGGTPYDAANINCHIEEGLMVPASALNALRRAALEELTALRGKPKQHLFKSANLPVPEKRGRHLHPEMRVRVSRAGQLTPLLMERAAMISLPLSEFSSLDPEIPAKLGDKLAVELPRIRFGEDSGLDAQLDRLREIGVSHILAGNLWCVRKGLEHGFAVHGDFGLNITNSLSLEAYAALGLADTALSFELSLERARLVTGRIPAGFLAYGYLPLMVTRNRPAGSEGNDFLTDRLGNRFALSRNGGVTELYNMTPLYLADRMEDFAGFDFATLYFTSEAPERCDDIFEKYLAGTPTEEPKTRGLYYRKVL